MNDILEIELILKKQKYSCIYNFGMILIIILLIFVYVSCTYKYKTYYITSGVYKNGNLEMLVNVDDIKYIARSNVLNIDNELYQYNIDKISESNIVDDIYNSYKYVYLRVSNLRNIDNYVYQIKIEKENKKIIEYLKDYL